MNIFCISGSAKKDSTNVFLLQKIANQFSEHTFRHGAYLKDLPLFFDGKEADESVKIFREELKNSDAVIISTPEYSYNIPALLKNAFEWTTASGEFSGKKVLAILYVPNRPRGEKAMISLTYTLNAQNAITVATLHLDHKDIDPSSNNQIKSESLSILKEALELLKL